MRAFILILLLVAAPAGAVQPDEVLGDPALEARARVLSKELRCVVCPNQSIDDSDAGVARDLRLLLRERLEAGDSDGQALDHIAQRYGEYVYLMPRFNWRNAVLWLGGPVVLILGIFGFRAALRAPERAAPAPLSEEERNRLDALLRDDADPR